MSTNFHTRLQDLRSNFRVQQVSVTKLPPIVEFAIDEARKQPGTGLPLAIVHCGTGQVDEGRTLIVLDFETWASASSIRRLRD